jgi:hypothetical protein
VNGTRKQTKKKKFTLAFKMIPILHNTLLANPKLKFYFGAFANFWGQPNPATTIVMGLNSNCTLGEFVLLGSHPNSNFTPGAFAHFGGPLGSFGVQGPKIKFYSSICPFGESPNLKFYPGGFCPFWGPSGAFWGSGAKIKFDFGAFTHR